MEWKRSEAHQAFSKDMRYTMLVVPLRTESAASGRPWYAWYVLDDEDATVVAQGHQESEPKAKQAAEAAVADALQVG